MAFKEIPLIRKEYRIIHVDNKVQVHHIVCSRRDTLVGEWPEKFPGGFSLEAIDEMVENHWNAVHFEEQFSS
jgi:hypothetical protein